MSRTTNAAMASTTTGTAIAMTTDTSEAMTARTTVSTSTISARRPTTTHAQADPFGTPAQRGAALFFAEGCASCHGARGQAPRPLDLSDSRELEQLVRQGKNGMPAFSPDQITDAQLADLRAYVDTFARRPGS